jgi:hypothetical protein
MGTNLVSETAVEEALPVCWFAPEYKTLTPMWDWFVDRLKLITVSKSEQEHQIKLITGGLLEMWTLENADGARGRKYKRVIIDEAAQDAKLLDHWNKVIRPTLIDYKGDAWFFSTPNGKNGFHKLWMLGADENNPEWMSWKRTSFDNPFLPREELDGLSATMTEEAYRQEILAEFLEGEGAVFRNLSACMHAPLDVIPEQHAGHYIVAGVDWGMKNDYTVISIGCATCRREIARDRFNRIDWHFQRSRLREMITRWGVSRALVELNSIGGPNYEELLREGVPVTGFEMTPGSKPPLIQEMALELEKGTIQLQPDHYWTSELEAFEVTVGKTGNRHYGAPEGADFHDDTVIGRALMIRAMNEAPRKPAQPWQPPKLNYWGK